MIFGTILRISQHRSDEMWKSKKAGGGGNKKKINFVLTRQDKKFFISELFKVIQDAIPLILHSRTMCQFRTISSSTYIILDVQSVYTPSQIQDRYREDVMQSSFTIHSQLIVPRKLL